MRGQTETAGPGGSGRAAFRAAAGRARSGQQGKSSSACCESLQFGHGSSPLSVPCCTRQLRSAPADAESAADGTRAVREKPSRMRPELKSQSQQQSPPPQRGSGACSVQQQQDTAHPEARRGPRHRTAATARHGSRTRAHASFGAPASCVDRSHRGSRPASGRTADAELGACLLCSGSRRRRCGPTPRRAHEHCRGHFVPRRPRYKRRPLTRVGWCGAEQHALAAAPKGKLAESRPLRWTAPGARTRPVASRAQFSRPRTGHG
jgi:hypothetical protein